MKFFYKFLISAIAISIIPLIVYTIILLNTSMKILKEIIDNNNINLVNNITREVNDFFIDIERRLDIARKIENSNMTKNEIIKVLFDELSSNSDLLMCISLLDNNWKPIITISSDNTVFNIDKELLRKIQKSKVGVGKISYNENNKPYIDVVYEIEKQPNIYFYIRIKVEYILNKIKQYLHTDKKQTSKTIFLIDEYGEVVSFPYTNIHSIPKQKLDKYRNKFFKKTFIEISGNNDKFFLENKKINILSMTDFLQWLILFQEPIGKAYAPIIRTRNIAIVLIILTTFCAFFGALKLSKNLAEPIKELITGVEIVANGNFDYRVPIISEDELSKLGLAFNSMASKLKNFQQEVKEAERLSTIGQMANILGHEIRNPLSAIVNATYLLKLQLSKTLQKDDKIFKNITIIENEVASINKIIGDMLSFSRKRPPVLVEKDINEVVEEVVQEYILPSNIQLNLLLSSEMVKIKIDYEEIKQVIRNLINNAIDSMKEKSEGKLTVKVFLEASFVCIEVSDTGCGIPQKDIGKIFEPFFSTKAKGTGLGLAVVRRIIEERHNGKIEVSSKEGEGTSFIVKLPRNI
ncbi:MAG: ATP-binding protein [Elusimicrobiota bacterium]|nr:ATP-binding protein [Endomicrobiia bacterium]MDW8166470.1 ATP-binding protein [Elusimicrobiota bacterium]